MVLAVVDLERLRVVGVMSIGGYATGMRLCGWGILTVFGMGADLAFGTGMVGIGMVGGNIVGSDCSDRLSATTLSLVVAGLRFALGTTVNSGGLPTKRAGVGLRAIFGSTVFRADLSLSISV